ncbi:MAG: hypothetical protein ACJ8BW_41220, partial [Ktedonobacteraceae bacterium]
QLVAALILQHEQSADRVGGGTTRITEERQRILKTEMEVASDLEAKGGILCALLSWQAQL